MYEVSGPVAIQVWHHPIARKTIILLSDRHNSEYGLCSQTKVENVLYDLYTPNQEPNFVVLLESELEKSEDPSQIIYRKAREPLSHLRYISDSQHLTNIINIDVRIGVSDKRATSKKLRRIVVDNSGENLSMLEIYHLTDVVVALRKIVTKLSEDPSIFIDENAFVTKESLSKHEIHFRPDMIIFFVWAGYIKLRDFIYVYENHIIDKFIIEECEKTGDRTNCQIKNLLNFREMCSFWNNNNTEVTVLGIKEFIFDTISELKHIVDKFNEKGEITWKDYKFIVDKGGDLDLWLVEPCMVFMDIYSMHLTDFSQKHVVTYYGKLHNDLLAKYLASQGYNLELNVPVKEVHLNAKGNPIDEMFNSSPSLDDDNPDLNMFDDELNVSSPSDNDNPDLDTISDDDELNVSPSLGDDNPDLNMFDDDNPDLDTVKIEYVRCHTLSRPLKDYLI